MPKRPGKHVAIKPTKSPLSLLSLSPHKAGAFIGLPALLLTIPFSGMVQHSAEEGAQVVAESSPTQKTQEVSYTPQKALRVTAKKDSAVASATGVVTAKKAPEPPKPKPTVAAPVAKPAQAPQSASQDKNAPVVTAEHANPAQGASQAPEGSSRPAQGSSGGSTDSGVQAPAGVREKIISEAKKHIGLPYRYGGTSPVTGFDCSGYTQYVYRTAAGIGLPRTSGEQHGAGHVISISDAKPGDLVWMPGHVGIYAGKGMMYHSPHTGSSVKLASIWTRSYQIVRVIND